MKWSWTVITPLLCVVRLVFGVKKCVCEVRGCNWRLINPSDVECLRAAGVCAECSRVLTARPPLPVKGCFVFSLVKYKPLTYNKVYEYPDWAIALGWTLALASMICIPMVVVIKIIQSDGPLIEVGGVTW